MTKEEGKWIRPQDIETFSTSDPQQMLDKYLAESVRRTWTEDFIDEDTKETISIERSELILSKWTPLSQEAIQTIMFHIKAGDIESVKVTDTNFDSERSIPNRYIPWEVTCRFGMNRKKYLCRAQSIEKAITVVGDFGPLYLGDTGNYSVAKVEVKPVVVTDEDDVPQVGAPNKAKNYYIVTIRKEWWDPFDEEDKKQDTDYIVAAAEIGKAKENGILAAEAGIDADEMEKYDFRAIKAKPYSIDGILPMSYCELYFEKQDG